MPGQAELARALLAADRAVPAGLRPSGRFGVHRNNVVVGLVEALEAAYPAVRSLVGEAFFKAAAGVFVREEPPRSPVLIHYGAGFPAFIEGFPPAAGLPYLGDVARLERAWLLTYHAAEATPLPIAALDRLPEDELDPCRLALHPSLGLVASAFPIVALWTANTGRGPHDAVDLGRAETALVLRPSERVEVLALAPGMAAMVGALSSGEPLGAAAEAAALAEAEHDLGSALGRLFALGAVVGLRQSESAQSESAQS